MAELPEKADAADRACRAAKPTDKDLYIKDSKVSGLAFRVTKTGNKSWQLRYSVKIDGAWVGRKTTIGSFDKGIGTKAARDLAESMRGDIYKGADPIGDKKKEEENKRVIAHQEKQEQLSRVTMQDLFDEWLKTQLQDNEHGHKDGGEWAGGIIRNHILTTHAELEVKNFSVGIFNNIKQQALEAKHPRMANILTRLTKQMLFFAVAQEYIQANPLDTINMKTTGSVGKVRDRVLCPHEDPDTHERLPDELPELFRILPDSGLSESSQIALHLCASTCCRIGELLKAEWHHVDLESAKWTIPEVDSKNGKKHLVNLSGFALARFKRLFEISGDPRWVYPSRRTGEHVDPKMVTKQVADRQREDDSPLKNRTKKHSALKLPRGKWTPHDLRRTGATLMAELGTVGEVIERCLNHVVGSKVQRTYNKHSPRPAMQEAWSLLGAELERIESDSKDHAKTTNKAGIDKGKLLNRGA